MKKIALVLGVVFSLSIVGLGQNWTFTARRTVTNADLEKFKTERLKAEKDYRENYEKMGFPSPEELDRQREEDMAARIEFSNQLRQARLERERIDVERERLAVEAARIEADRQAAADMAGYRENYYYGGYPAYGTYGGYDYGGYGFGIRFGGYFPRYRYYRPYSQKRLLPNRGVQTYYVTPFGTVPAGTVQYPAYGYPGGGRIFGFPGWYR